MGNKSQSTFEKTFAAAAFAEAGEHDTAIRMADVTTSQSGCWISYCKAFRTI